MTGNMSPKHGDSEICDESSPNGEEPIRKEHKPRRSASWDESARKARNREHQRKYRGSIILNVLEVFQH